MENKEKIVEAEVVETKTEQQGTSLQDASVEQLKIAAFDTEQQYKAIQRNYQTIMNELQARMEKQNGSN